MDYKVLGKNIKSNRKKCNITQEQLAEMCDITPVFVSQIENAMRKPSLETVYNMSKMLNVSVDELLNSSNHITQDVTDIINLLLPRTPDELSFIYRVIKEILDNMDDGKILLQNK